MIVSVLDQTRFAAGVTLRIVDAIPVTPDENDSHCVVSQEKVAWLVGDLRPISSSSVRPVHVYVMIKSDVHSTQQDRKLYQGLVAASKTWKWKSAEASIHHGANDRGDPDPENAWFPSKEFPMRLQIHDDFIAHLQIRLEINRRLRRSRVIIFGRRVKSFTQRTGNTQHVTFNSTHIDDSGYWIRPTLKPAQATEVSRSLGDSKTPHIVDGRIYLGRGDSDTLLSRFLVSLGAVARAKPAGGSLDGVALTPKAFKEIVSSIGTRIRKAEKAKVADVSETTGWILIHSQERYEKYEFENPRVELEHLWPTRWNRHWHWKLPRPMKEDDRPRTLLFAWDQCVFGRATATVTRAIARNRQKNFNFAFVLSDYQPSNLIPLSALRLGKRENNHRGLLQLRPENLEAFEAAKRGKTPEGLRLKSIPELAQIEWETERSVNPHKSARQGVGLTVKEKKCVELYAMGKAKAHLEDDDFAVDDVSSRESFDLHAKRNGSELFVEVKGTIGEGAEILLTKSEVDLQRFRHPANMLIVVHSISLRRGDQPQARGGILLTFPAWQIEGQRLTATSFSYRLY